MPQFLTSLFSLSPFQVFQTLTLLTSVPCSVTSEFLAHSLSLFQVVRTLSHFALNVMKGLMKPPLRQYLIEPSGRLKVSVGVGRDYGVLIILIAVMAVLHVTPNRTVPCNLMA